MDPGLSDAGREGGIGDCLTNSRPSTKGIAAMSSHDATPPEWDANRLRIASDAAGVALWSWNVDTNRIAMDARAHGLWDVPASGAVTFEDLSARIHPEDLDRSEEHTSELQSLAYLVCRLLLEKKKQNY